MEIVKIDPKQYGLTETKAKEISAMFKPMLEQMEALEAEFNAVAALKISGETCQKAKALRLKYVSIRTGTAAIHKELKAFYLQGGRFVDGWKNAQLMASEGIEKKLIAIEKYYENKEKDRVRDLQVTRADILLRYDAEFIPNNLGEMVESVWENYLLGVKSSYEAVKKAEEEAEKQRVEEEKLDKLVLARKLEMGPLSEFHEGEELDLRKISEEDYRKHLSNLKALKLAYNKRQEEIATENERLKRKAEEEAEKAKKEKEKTDLKVKKLSSILIEAGYVYNKQTDSYNKEECYINGELLTTLTESSLGAMVIQHNTAINARKQIKEAAAAQEAELKKGDADKLADLINDLEALKTKYVFKSATNKKKYKGVQELLTKVINYVK